MTDHLGSQRLVINTTTGAIAQRMDLTSTSGGTSRLSSLASLERTTQFGRVCLGLPRTRGAAVTDRQRLDRILGRAYLAQIATMAAAFVGSVLLLKAHTDYERLVLVLASMFGAHWIALTIIWRVAANTLERDREAAAPQKSRAEQSPP